MDPTLIVNGLLALVNSSLAIYVVVSGRRRSRRLQLVVDEMRYLVDEAERLNKEFDEMRRSVTFAPAGEEGARGNLGAGGRFLEAYE